MTRLSLAMAFLCACSGGRASSPPDAGAGAPTATSPPGAASATASTERAVLRADGGFEGVLLVHGPAYSAELTEHTDTTVPHLCPCPDTVVPTGVPLLASGANGSPPPNALLADGVYRECVDERTRAATSIPLCRQSSAGQEDAYDGVVAIQKAGLTAPSAYVTFVAKSNAPGKCRTEFTLTMKMASVPAATDTWRTLDSIRNVMAGTHGAEYPKYDDFNVCATNNRYVGTFDVH